MRFGLSVGRNFLYLSFSFRTIKLSYLDVYALSLTLPYPVFDNKGAAKFDKTKKTLTLTLPVRPAEIVSMNAEVVEVITEVNDDLSQQIPAKEEIVDASNTGKAHKKKDESSIHSRWVAKEESMEKSTEDLKKEIAEQTKLTMEQKHQPIAKPSFEKSSQKARVTFTDNVDSTTTKVSVAVENCDWTEDFYPSDVFSGRRNGYIFKNGIFGVGYYKDQQQILKNGTTPDVSTKQEISDTKIVSSFPFETRQTLQTVAILVQVPAILRETVRVEYTNRSVNVQFSVLLDVSGEAKAGTEETSTHYGALLEITADCYDGIIPEQCRYDVAAQNMVIVLMKKNEVYWEELKAGELLIAKEIPLSESIKTTYKKVEQQAEKASTISKALESTIAQLQFSKNDAIYDLD